jgi:protein-tyrosine phosphatase
MFDLNCHLLPGIDDGAIDPGMALEMARIAAADGIHTIACTPHVRPGGHDHAGRNIRAAVQVLQAELDAYGIELRLLEGADALLDPGLATDVRAGRIPTLAGSHYLLVEPPRQRMPPRFEEAMFGLMAMGITPLVAHPERLAWIESHYDLFARLAGRGVWMQVTAGALTGNFGKRVQYWGERFVGEGHCHVLATDAHHPRHSPPLLAAARDAAAVLVGRDAAEHMVLTRPAGIVADADPTTLPPPLAVIKGLGNTPRVEGRVQAGVVERQPGSAWRRILRGLRGQA